MFLQCISWSKKISPTGLATFVVWLIFFKFENVTQGVDSSAFSALVFFCFCILHKEDSNLGHVVVKQYENIILKNPWNYSFIPFQLMSSDSMKSLEISGMCWFQKIGVKCFSSLLEVVLLLAYFLDLQCGTTLKRWQKKKAWFRWSFFLVVDIIQSLNIAVFKNIYRESEWLYVCGV